MELVAMPDHLKRLVNGLIEINDHPTRGFVQMSTGEKFKVNRIENVLYVESLDNPNQKWEVPYPSLN